MIYKQVKTIPTVYINTSGKSATSKEQIGVGKFENENSETYTLFCVIDKSMGSEENLIFEANRIAELLNKNKTIFSREEVENLGELNLIKD